MIEKEPNLAKVNAAVRKRAEEWGHPHDSVRRRLVFERLLDRLARVEESPVWCLKGGMSLLVTIDSLAGRPTKDMDLALAVSMDVTGEAVREVLSRACALDLGDGFELAVSEVLLATRMTGIGGQGFRVRVVSQFRGLRFQSVELDVSVHETVEHTVARRVEGVLPWVAGFDVPTICPEVTFAEKLHAMTRRYGENRDRSSTRPRDLPDMVALVRQGALNPELSRELVAETFLRRGTHAVPAELLLPPGFETAFSRYGAGYGLEAMTAEEGLALVTRFLEEADVLERRV